MDKLLKFLSLPKRLFTMKQNRKGIRGLYSSKSYKKDQVILNFPLFETKNKILNTNIKLKTFCINSQNFGNLSRNGQFATVLGLSGNKKNLPYWNMIKMTKESLSWNIWFWELDKLQKESKKNRFYKDYHNKLQNDYNLFGFIYEEYKSIHGNIIFNMTKKTFQDKCILFRIIITSRGFSSNGQGIALVPLLDLMNHETQDNYNVKWDFDNHAFRITAIKNIKKEEELFVSYGSKSDESFIMYYGFIPSRK